MKKHIINVINESYNSLICEDSDGWNDQVQETLNEVISNLESFIYEIRNCVKGSFTNVETHSALADYIRGLAVDLNYAADQIEGLPDDPEEIDEAAVETPKDTDNIILGEKPFKNKIKDNEDEFIVMVGHKYVKNNNDYSLTDDPNQAGSFYEYEAKDVTDNLKLKIIKVINKKELFTDNKFDQDKANIYFKYNTIYESIQRTNKRK